MRVGRQTVDTFPCVQGLPINVGRMTHTGVDVPHDPMASGPGSPEGRESAASRQALKAIRPRPAGLTHGHMYGHMGHARSDCITRRR